MSSPLTPHIELFKSDIQYFIEHGDKLHNLKDETDNSAHL